ncbi:neurogenic locus notch homolog protein 2-like [Pocillopora damicornis]|uniref:neurogenic locus notch homolog protein 2-like n=1 Tax=Pocillopora damicornis TaxID=46731 RepID=UPI000F559B2C|nr:neurogenic locus notch homolog protein 2-like [Pocillopora damicornis]
MFFGLLYPLLFELSVLIPDPAFSQESNPVYREGNRASSTRTFLTRTFIKHEFHHLNVPLVGTVAVSDVFDCTLECLSNPLCYSVNLAAFKGTHGKLWCELLSSDKFRNSTEYKGNKSSHHFAIESPCSSSPCQHEATCVTNYRDGSFGCRCAKGFKGEYCEKGE